MEIPDNERTRSDRLILRPKIQAIQTDHWDHCREQKYTSITIDETIYLIV
jgi:hypothetical protein